MSTVFRLSICAPIFLVSHVALAQQDPDRATDKPLPKSTEVVRPWLYNDDATIPEQLQAVGALTNTYSGNDRSVSRAFASADSGPGGKAGVSVQLGLVHMLALEATGVVGGFGSGVGGGLMGGLRFAPFANAAHGFRLAIAAGYVLDLDRASGAYTRVTATYDVGRLRVAAMVHGEHVFRDGSDAVDLFATAGISVRLLPAFRLGLEYIVQDIEEAFASKSDDDDDTAPVPGRAEGGVHQFLGVGGTFDLLRHRLFINLGPALAFRTDIGKVEPVGRALVSYTF
jgi:hypothetical protein